jgi:hypothetical protein
VNTRMQMLCAWTGPILLLTFVIALWLFAGYVPPMSPSLTAEEVAAIYRENTTMIRIGMLCVIASCGLVASWVAVITVQMKRIEGARPVLAYTQLAAGAVGIFLFLLPAMCWTLAAFRPDRDPQLTMLINDLGWFILVMPFGPPIVQNFAIGLAVLTDKSPRPVFPRWVGYFNIWSGVLFIPGGMVTFFKTGPFAWSGLLAFWVPLFVFGAWFLAMFVALRGAIRQDTAQVSRP